jgi:phage terminase small subunit
LEQNITEIAKKQRYLYLLNKVKQNKNLNSKEIKELEGFEAMERRKAKRANKAQIIQLTAADRYEIFCREYIVNLDATEAAGKAKYSEKTAASQGSRLLKNVNIQRRIRVLKKERERRSQIKADRVIEELGKLAFSDIVDFLEQDPENNSVKMKRLDSLTPEQRACIAEITEYEDDKGRRRFKFKLYDKPKCLELLGKHFSLFEENVNQRFPDGIPTGPIRPQMSEEQWKNFQIFLKTKQTK